MVLAVFSVQVAVVEPVELEIQVLIFQLILMVERELQMILVVQLYSTVVVEVVVYFVVQQVAEAQVALEVVGVVLVLLLRAEQLEHLEQTQELLGQLILMDKEVLLELIQVAVVEVVAELVLMEVEMVVQV